MAHLESRLRDRIEKLSVPFFEGTTHPWRIPFVRSPRRNEIIMVHRTKACKSGITADPIQRHLGASIGVDGNRQDPEVFKEGKSPVLELGL